MVNKAIDSKKTPIRCISCKIEMNIHEIKACASDKLFEEYENLTTKIFLEQNSLILSSCPTSKCSYMFEFDNNSYEYNCPICKRAYCLYCRNINHKGRKCVSNKSQNVIGFNKGQKLKACPVCGYWIEKKDGDKLLRCKCGITFCYFCGIYAGKCNC